MHSSVSRVTEEPRDGGRVDYRALADLRYQIRLFLRAREVAARGAGVEPQQFVLLLQIKGLERRGAPPTVGALAERLQIQHHAAVQLVDRLVRRGLVERRHEGPDRREVVIGLRPSGEAVLDRLARDSVAELRTEGPLLLESLSRLVVMSTRGGRPPRRGRRGDT